MTKNLKVRCVKCNELKNLKQFHFIHFEDGLEYDDMCRDCRAKLRKKEKDSEEILDLLNELDFCISEYNDMTNGRNVRLRG